MEDFGIRMLLSECTVANLIHVLCPVVRLSFFRSFALRNKLQRPHLAISLQEINPLLLGFTRTCASRMAHRLRQDKISCFSAQKPPPCPEAATQAATTTAAAADQAADHCKAFPKPLRAGFWLAAILTMSERGANEVQTRSEIRFWGDWPPKSPDKLFGSHTLSHSFQNS